MKCKYYKRFADKIKCEPVYKVASIRLACCRLALMSLTFYWIHGHTCGHCAHGASLAIE